MGVLRVLLALAVVITHSDTIFGIRLVEGPVAVEIFFLISGFYMTMILDSKYTGKGSYYLFLSNRALRLYPIYWTVISLTIVASIASNFISNDWGIMSPFFEYNELTSTTTFLFQIATNIALIGQDVVMFLGINETTGNMYFTSNFREATPQLHSFLLAPQAWSLGIEITFYFFAPFVVNRSNAFLATAIIASLCIRVFTYFGLGYDNDPWTYRFFPSELALFLLGTVSYRIYNAKIHLTSTFYKFKKNIVAIYAFAIIFNQFIPNTLSIKNWALYMFTCFTLPVIFEYTKKSAIDSRIGELSYPIYISHILVITLIYPFTQHFNLQFLYSVLVCTITVAIAYLLVVLISDPIEKIRKLRLAESTAKVGQHKTM